MNAKTYLKLQIKRVWGLQDSVVNGLTDELLVYQPPGTASPIGVIWLHSTSSEDGFISMLSGNQKLWDSGDWKDRFGLESVPNIGEDWREYHECSLTVNDLKAFTQAVREQTTACLESLTDESLDEPIKFFTENDLKAEVWSLLVAHSMHHFGEISAIVGVQGGKGLPF